MKVIKTIGPNQAGAKKFKALYGNRLVAVRYRKEPGRRLITIEVIVDEHAAPQDAGGPLLIYAQSCDPVAIRVRYDEAAIRTKIKSLGARWSRLQKIWYLPRHQVVALGLAHCIVEGAVDRCVDVDFLFQE